MHNEFTCFYLSGDVIRSRSVSDLVFSSCVDVPAPPPGLTADWTREIATRLGLEPGNVEEMPLPRARARWPQFGECLRAVSDWVRIIGLGEMLASSERALMVCRGAKYHHDAEGYGGMAFCNLFLSEDKGLDLHFPDAGRRIPLSRGTVVVFDTAQPHAVIARGGEGFNSKDFLGDQDCDQVFLTWELPIGNVKLANLLQVTFDTASPTSLQPNDAQIWRDGKPATVCPNSGQWLGCQSA